MDVWAKKMFSDVFTEIYWDAELKALEDALIQAELPWGDWSLCQCQLPAGRGSSITGRRSQCPAGTREHASRLDGAHTGDYAGCSCEGKHWLSTARRFSFAELQLQNTATFTGWKSSLNDNKVFWDFLLLVVTGVFFVGLWGLFVCGGVFFFFPISLVAVFIY